MGGWCDLEFLKETEDFGAVFEKDGDIEEFIDDLVSFIERRVYNKIAKRVNFLLTRVNDQKFEFVADGNDDKDQDGNLRIINSGGNFLFQKRNGDSETGTWDDENEIITTS